MTIALGRAFGRLDPHTAGILEPLTCQRLGDEPRAAEAGAPSPSALGALSPEACARAVETAYRHHHGLVYRVALRYGRGDPSWAEDVTHDVFLDLHAALPGLDDLGALEGWLYRAATNRCLNRLRRERFLSLAPVRWLLGDRQQEPRPPDALAVARDDLRRAFEVLDALPVKERVAFCMYHLDGLGQEEIGRVLGHSKGYVCKLIQRAEDRLRARCGEVDRG